MQQPDILVIVVLVNYLFNVCSSMTFLDAWGRLLLLLLKSVCSLLMTSAVKGSIAVQRRGSVKGQLCPD